jgi:hypothetical protein
MMPANTNAKPVNGNHDCPAAINAMNTNPRESHTVQGCKACIMTAKYTAAERNKTATTAE